MLEMKEHCDKCNAPTPMDGEAFICSHECSFCGPCTRGSFDHVCPNCGGELVARPKRKKK